jgi:glycosyltransferase involved in cell wall biosynthesis
VRVVHLTSSHQPDDVRIFLKECRSLAQAGFEVHLVAPGASPQTVDGVICHGFALPEGPWLLRVPRRLLRAWRAARSVRADLYHFHEPELVLVALLLKLAGTRIVYDVHEDHLSTLTYTTSRSGGRQVGFRLLEAVARRVCDGFVAATPAIARRWPPERTVEVLNYPLLEELAPEPVASADRRGAVYVGVITLARGAREMVEASHRVRDPDTRLALIGSFGSPELEREARSWPGWERVDYLGRLGRAELRGQLTGARVGLVVLHPERNYMESFPTKLFEYMSAGLAVVVSDFPFFHELLDSIDCALYVDPLDPAEIAAAIDELTTDAAATEEMGRRGARAVRERLNWQREAPKLVDLYESVGVAVPPS